MLELTSTGRTQSRDARQGWRKLAKEEDQRWRGEAKVAGWRRNVEPAGSLRGVEGGPLRGRIEKFVIDTFVLGYQEAIR